MSRGGQHNGCPRQYIGFLIASNSSSNFIGYLPLSFDLFLTSIFRMIWVLIRIRNVNIDDDVLLIYT
jgi:hypothetical protein